MQHQKCSLQLYVDFLVASQRQYSGVELSRVSPKAMAHDSVSRWLAREQLTPAQLWQQSQPLVNRTQGCLILDDTVLDKPYARQMALVRYQYSGTHHGVVRGIGLINLLWTDGQRLGPVDYRLYDPDGDGKTKLDHGRDMLSGAERRQFQPRYVLMDAWYTAVANLKAIDAKGWRWIGQLKANRKVSVTRGTYLSVADLDWTATPVRTVWLKAYGFVQVCKSVTPAGDVAYLATSDRTLTDPAAMQSRYALRWTIETFHRGVKQCCGIERCYSTIERSQRNHILCALLAFVKLEWQRI